MMSTILGIEAVHYEKMIYVTKYKVLLEDRLPTNVRKYLQSVSSGNEVLLSPLQMSYLLDNVRTKTFALDTSLVLGMKLYKYIDDFVFPMVTINDIPIIQYDITCQIRDVDQIKSESVREQWETRIQTDLSDYLNYYKISLDQELYDSLLYLPTVLEDKPTDLHSYTNPGTIIGEQNEIIGFNSTVDQIHSWKLQGDVDTTYEENPLSEEEIFSVKPYFEYDRNLSNLIIPEPGTIPLADIDRVTSMLQCIQNKYGMSFRLSQVIKFQQEQKQLFDYYYQCLLTRFGVYDFSFNARKATPEHYGYQVCKYLSEDISRYMTKAGNMSFTKKHIEQLTEKYEKLNKVHPTEENKNALDMLKEVATALKCHTNLKLIKEIYSLLYPDSGAIRDDEHDRLTTHCTFSDESETRRITSSRPNIQGKTREIKGFLIPRSEDRSIISVDIKSQEPLILIFGVMQNKDLQRYVLETGDCYKAFAKAINIPYSKEVKEIIKVPVLSIMNGRSKRAIDELFDKLEGDSNYNHEVGNKIYKLIVEDPGYKEINKRAEKEAEKTVRGGTAIRKGLFGTQVQAIKKGKYGDDVNSRKRQVLNGNFQLTASEIVSYCLHAMLYDLYHNTTKYDGSLDENGNTKKKITIEELTPVTPVYDEMVFDVLNDVIDEAIDLIRFYCLPVIGNWVAMKEELTVGDHYVYKGNSALSVEEQD